MKRVNAIALFCCFLLFPSLSPAEYIHGNVASVYDGDTVTLSTGDKIRLAGIDAPEIKQPFGIQSRDALRSAVLNKPVTVSWSKVDKYGRKVGKIYYRRIDQNWRQVHAGLAWHYVKYSAEQSPRDRKRYATAEVTARAARTGLWSAPNPVAPWDWRHGLTVPAVPQ